MDAFGASTTARNIRLYSTLGTHLKERESTEDTDWNYTNEDDGSNSGDKNEVDQRLDKPIQRYFV